MLHVCHVRFSLEELIELCVGYVNMEPPQYDLVIADCDEALKLDVMYIKTLNRRGMALESLQRYEEALRGKVDFPSHFKLLTSYQDFTSRLQPSLKNSPTKILRRPSSV